MSILGMLTGNGTKDLIEGVGGGIDNLNTSREEGRGGGGGVRGGEWL